MRFIDDIYFIAEVERCGFAFIAVDAIKEKRSGLPDDTGIVKHRFHAKDPLDVL